MVRTYVRKRAPPSYSKETLLEAMGKVKRGEMTLYRASKAYGIPKATLFKRVKGKRGEKSKSMGRPPSIPHAEEKVIADCLKTMERWGFGLSKKEVLATIGRYVRENGISTPFKEEARNQNVTILKLPPHTTHVLQPMDLCVFKPMKDKWDEELVKWQRKNYGRKLPKSIFATVLAKVWKTLDPSTIEKGGIFPFNDKVIPKDRFDPAQYRRWSDMEENKNTTELEPGTSTTISSPRGNSSSPLGFQPLRSEIGDPVPSASHSLPPVRKISFEELLLEQVKQAPRLNIKRRKVCGGAEVITSEEVLVKLKAISDSKKMERNGRSKRKTMAKEEHNSEEEEEEVIEELRSDSGPDSGRARKKGKKKIEAVDCSEDEGVEESLQSESDSDAFNFQEKQRETEEESNFLEVVSKTILQAAVNDWVLVKLASGNSVKMFVGQLIEIEDCLEAKLSRRIGSTSTFRWPNVEDKNIILGNEIVHFLPPPVFDKRGKFTFPLSFASYKIG